MGPRYEPRIVWMDSPLPSCTDARYRQTDVSAPEKMGTVARSAVRSTTKEREPGGGVKGVEIMGAVVEAGGMSPHAFRVSVPAPNPINLRNSLRVILLMGKFS